MGNADTRRLDREISKTTRKLEAVRKGEMWPLTSAERRAVIGALAGGSYRVPARQEHRPRGEPAGLRRELGRDPADRRTDRAAHGASADRARGRRRQGREEGLRLVVTPARLA